MEQVGTRQRPAIATVPSAMHAERVLLFCQKNGWQASIRIAPKETVEMFEIYLLGLAQNLKRDNSHTNRNEICPCGSGKKFKKCCQKQIEDDIRSLLTPGSPRYLEAQSYYHNGRKIWGTETGALPSPTG